MHSSAFQEKRFRHRESNMQSHRCGVNDAAAIRFLSDTPQRSILGHGDVPSNMVLDLTVEIS
jgi:hypothetical protein